MLVLLYAKTRLRTTALFGCITGAERKICLYVATLAGAAGAE